MTGSASSGRASSARPLSVGQSILCNDEWQRVARTLCLSPRELELVQRIFERKKLSAIAQDMRLSIGTVRTYSQRIHHKLAVSDQRDLVLTIFGAYRQLSKL